MQNEVHNKNPPTKSPKFVSQNCENWTILLKLGKANTCKSQVTCSHVPCVWPQWLMVCVRLSQPISYFQSIYSALLILKKKKKMHFKCPKFLPITSKILLKYLSLCGFFKLVGWVHWYLADCIYIYIYVCGFLKLASLSKLIFGRFFLKKEKKNIGRFYICVCVWGGGVGH